MSAFVKKSWRPVAAILFLFLLIKKGPFKLEQIEFVLTQKYILMLGLVLFFAQFVLFSLRWKSFVDLVSQIEIKPAFKLTLIGQFFSFFIPGGVGGDVVKALELSHHKKIAKSISLSTVIADRVFGLFAMIFFSAFFLLIEMFYQPTESITHFFYVSLLLFLGVSFGLLFSPALVKYFSFLFQDKNSKILHKIEKFIHSFNLTFNSFRNIKLQLQNIFVCAIIQFISVYFMYQVVRTIGVEPPSFLIFFSLCCFGFLASAIPLTPAGIGVGQAAFYFLFSTIRVELGQAAVTAVSMLQLFNLLFALFGGFFFSFQPKTKNQREQHG